MRDIVNHHTPRLYANLDQASNAIFIFEKRFHESIHARERENIKKIKNDMEKNKDSLI
jgi:hypothetical protein